MGFETILSKVSPPTESLKTPVPQAIVKQFDLRGGNKLEWTLTIKNKNLIIDN